MTEKGPWRYPKFGIPRILIANLRGLHLLNRHVVCRGDPDEEGRGESSTNGDWLHRWFGYTHRSQSLFGGWVRTPSGIGRAKDSVGGCAVPKEYGSPDATSSVAIRRRNRSQRSELKRQGWETQIPLDRQQVVPSSTVNVSHRKTVGSTPSSVLVEVETKDGYTVSPSPGRHESEDNTSKLNGFYSYSDRRSNRRVYL